MIDEEKTSAIFCLSLYFCLLQNHTMELFLITRYIFNRELLSKQSKDIFWEFTDLWLEPDKGSNCLTARCCIQKIVDDSRTLLSEALGSIFEFSFTLRSASPRIVLYRQLAEDSLSSYPIYDEINSASITGEKQIPDANYFLSTPIARNHGGHCCWVDTGNALLFNTTELLVWFKNSSNG